MEHEILKTDNSGMELKTNCYTTDTVSKLSNGVLHFYISNLTNVKQQLTELTVKQTVLVEQLHDENLKICWAKNSDDLNDMFNTIRAYQAKLVNIKKDMQYLHDKSSKLRKRALRLQQHKEKEDYIRIQQVQQEQDLIAKRDK